MDNYDKKAILDAMNKAEIPQSHWDDFNKMNKDDDIECQKIAEGQAVDDKEMLRTFSL